MGEHEVTSALSQSERREFIRAVLEDVHALERMIAEGLIETGIRRIGAEQEMFLVDPSLRPAPIAEEMLERLDHPQFTPELGRFNLEANLDPRRFEGTCLSDMESELEGLMNRARRTAIELDSQVVLCGILPTLEQRHLDIDLMTRKQRYHQLNQVMRELRGAEFETYIKGTDELQTRHDNVMFEACNTSFQVHFQVAPEEFAELYNVAQAVTAPVLAAAVNSPLLLQHRLWHETRVALFQQSLDERSEAFRGRGTRTRVSFGDAWVRDSVMEIFREDVARFRVLLAGELDESPAAVLDRGEIPKLSALRLHNGTVYRWNRACYGIGEGKPHLRIENRVLPAGPTVPDEIANAAFFYGLMSGLDAEVECIAKAMPFDHAKANFHAAARYGLEAQFRWLGGPSITAQRLILETLLPLARSGLERREIGGSDIDRYLGLIEDRVRSGRTGAQWMLDSWDSMSESATRDERCRTLVGAMVAHQAKDQPGHLWEVARPGADENWRHSYRFVRQVMTTDLFTVAPEDLVDLAASLMDWQHLRHVPVEDREGKLVGILSHRQMLRLVGRGLEGEERRSVAVSELMRPDPVTVCPETPTLEAIAAMRDHKVGCLPVVEEGRLVGIVTEHDFIEVAGKLLEEELRQS